MHNEGDFMSDPHLCVLHPSSLSRLYPWTLKGNTDDEVMRSLLLVTQSRSHIMNIAETALHVPSPPFNLSSSCIILMSPIALHVVDCSAVTTPCSICLSIFLPFSAVTLFFQTRSLVKGLRCNCTEAPACWNTVAPLAAEHWFIWLKTFYSLAEWLREPLGPYRIECLWQRNLRFSVDVSLRL